MSFQSCALRNDTAALLRLALFRAADRAERVYGHWSGRTLPRKQQVLQRY